MAVKLSGMKTHLDHATVVTCRGAKPEVLKDTSITFDGGVITAIGPTAALLGEAGAVPAGTKLKELQGRPLGRILVQLGKVTPQQVDQALELKKTQTGVIGQVLIRMGAVTEADVDYALAIQAGHLPVDQQVDVISARNRLVIPGLVNTHHHLFQSLTRCMPAVQNATLFEWLTALYPVWRGLSYDALRQAAMVSIAELLLGGCTTTSDHQYLFPRHRDVSIEAVLEAAESLGIRIHACRGSMSLGQSAGGLPPDNCTQDAAVILEDCQRAIGRFHDPKPMAMRRVDLAPCSPFSVTPELLEDTRLMAVERNVLLHTHAAETLDEEKYCLEKFGARPIEYLSRCGWLGENVYLAHCVHLNVAEIALLARTGTGVAHCPSSNMRLGSGIAPVRTMIDAGVKVGIGVDGSSSNDGGNLLLEARQALLLQRVEDGPGALTTAEAFRLATVGGADVLHRPELGRIEAGCAADLAVYDARDIAFAGAIAQDPLGALMLCHAPRPERVIVAGKTVVQDGQVCGQDWPQVVADFNQLVSRHFR